MCLAVPGKIISISGEEPLSRSARVSFGGAVREVSLACVPEAKLGDYVLVHVGFAIARLDEAEAARTLAAIEELAAAGRPGTDALPR
jgi:hydrogenase expression/formation protein HypC